MEDSHPVGVAGDELRRVLAAVVYPVGVDAEFDDFGVGQFVQAQERRLASELLELKGVVVVTEDQAPVGDRPTRLVHHPGCFLVGDQPLGAVAHARAHEVPAAGLDGVVNQAVHLGLPGVKAGVGSHQNQTQRTQQLLQVRGADLAGEITRLRAGVAGLGHGLEHAWKVIRYCLPTKDDELAAYLHFRHRPLLLPVEEPTDQERPACYSHPNKTGPRRSQRPGFYLARASPSTVLPESWQIGVRRSSKVGAVSRL